MVGYDFLKKTPPISQIPLLDIKIIEEFYKLKRKEEKTISQIGKSILKNNPKDREYHFIQRRIISMSKKGIFKIGRNSSVNAILDLDKIFIQRFSFPTKRSKGVAILINGKYQIFEL